MSFVYANACTNEPFGEAGLYNLYSLSTIYGCNSDVEGRVAANGPIVLENYSVGLLNQVNEWYSLVCHFTFLSFFFYLLFIFFFSSRFLLQVLILPVVLYGMVVLLVEMFLI